MSGSSPLLEPHYRVRWVLTLPPIAPAIARECMNAPVPWPVRLVRQVIPRSQLRDCCWHHSIDWRQSSAVAIRLARQLRRERLSDPDELADRVYELVRASGLHGGQKYAVEALLNPFDALTLDRLVSERRWRVSYMNGRKRTHVMFEAGVRRTVTVRWRELPGRKP